MWYVITVQLRHEVKNDTDKPMQCPKCPAVVGAYTTHWCSVNYPVTADLPGKAEGVYIRQA